MSHSEMVTTRRGLRRYPALGWAAVAVGGLMLALAAWSGPPGGTVTGAPPARLVIGMPDWLKMTVLGLFVVAALLVLVALLPMPARRRRKKDDEFEIVHETPRPSWVVLLALLVPALLLLACIVAVLWFAWPIAAPEQDGLAGSPTTPAQVEALRSERLRPDVKSPLFTGAVTVLGLLAGLTAVCLILWILFGDRIGEWWTGLTPWPQATRPLLAAVEESLDVLRRDPDARRAIIRCYRRFEMVLGGSGVPRAPWETPAEFIRKALNRLRVPAPAIQTLTGLFEISRFSQRPVGPAERDAALDSLIEVKSTLERETAYASVD